MPVRCYVKPNRTSPRPYTEKDLSRIAGYVNESGVPWATIFGVLAISAGVAFLFCRARALVDLAQELRTWALDIVDFSAAITLVGWAIRLLLSGRSFPVWNVIAAGMVTFLTATLVLLRSLQRRKQLLEDASSLREVLLYLESICDAAEARAVELAQQGKEGILSARDRLTFLGDLPDGNIN